MFNDSMVFISHMSLLQIFPFLKIKSSPKRHLIIFYLIQPHLALFSHPLTSPSTQYGRYTFMNKTLSTPETVPIWQAFYRPSRSSDPALADFGEVICLIALGSALDGHLHTAHGGVAAALLDEAMGTVGGIHKTRGKSQFTAFLHVNYRKPLPTPGMICIKAKIDGEKSKGRKIFINASLESGDGVVYNDANGLFLETDRKHRAKL
jgi:acyl-coenzyme A thioesterase PaaI-like protein